MDFAEKSKAGRKQAILNLVWMEGQRNIPSAIRFGVDKVFLRTNLCFCFWLTMVPGAAVKRATGRVTDARYSIVRRHFHRNIICPWFGLAATLFSFLCI